MSNEKETFVVEDMHCNACVNTITKTLTSTGHVNNVNADLSSKEVEVEYDPENYDVEEILSSLDMIGFPATIKKNHKYLRHDLRHVFKSRNLRSFKNEWHILHTC